MPSTACCVPPLRQPTGWPDRPRRCPGRWPARTISAARGVVARLRGQAEDLLARLDNTDARLSELEEAALSARNFDTATWPARRDAIAARLAADPAGGAADWLAAWARAFLLGC